MSMWSGFKALFCHKKSQKTDSSSKNTGDNGDISLLQTCESAKHANRAKAYKTADAEQGVKSHTAATNTLSQTGGSVKRANRAKGNRGEDIAAAYMKKRKMKVLCRNYRTRVGEVDIVARDGDVLVFTEVKMRSRDDYGGGRAAVNRAKQQKIIKTAKLYIIEHAVSDLTPIRFDVAELFGDEIEYIEDAFWKN
ncbi:MAG: YraN family protein [Clostridia bacterium]|nr:YraN family protein [Clostridia bacterium]